MLRIRALVAVETVMSSASVAGNTMLSSAAPGGGVLQFPSVAQSPEVPAVQTCSEGSAVHLARRAS